MRVRCCIRCDARLAERSTEIDGRRFTVWVRVCRCESVNGCGWYFRAIASVAPVDDDDDIPAFDDPIPVRPKDIFDTIEPLTERRYA